MMPCRSCSGVRDAAPRTAPRTSGSWGERAPSALAGAPGSFVVSPPCARARPPTGPSAAAPMVPAAPASRSRRVTVFAMIPPP